MPAPSRDEAWELFCEWTESESLRKHALGVEAAMRAYLAWEIHLTAQMAADTDHRFRIIRG